MPKQCEQNESTQLPPLHRATDELICDLADLFKIFGDTTRMRILYALQEG